MGTQTGTARNAAKGGTTVKNGSTARNGNTASSGSTARNGSGSTARNGSAARSGGSAARGGSGGSAARGGSGGTATRDGNGRDGARTGAARSGAAARGSQTVEIRDEVAERGPAPWLQITTLVLALAGLGVSIYLTIAHFTESALAGCSESGLVNCTKVTTSPESYVFGIPVAVLGLAFFVFAATIMSPWAWQSARREIHLARIVSMVVGIGFVLYLIYAELFIIGSICLYCTSVHVITFVLFVLTVFAAAAWGLKPGRPWK
jgi:uncharacterized membrane protein